MKKYYNENKDEINERRKRYRKTAEYQEYMKSYRLKNNWKDIYRDTLRGVIRRLGTKKEGKTVVVVHHDLQTAKLYFDWIVLLNTRLVASGPKDHIFNEALLQEAYGGKLNVLSKVGELIKEKDFPVREN